MPRLKLPDFRAVRDRFVTVAAAELYSSMKTGEPLSAVFAEAMVVGVAQQIVERPMVEPGSRSWAEARSRP